MMREYPENWKIMKQSDFSTFYNGRAFKQKEFKDSGTPIVRIQNLTGKGQTVYTDMTLKDEKYISEGDLIYAWSATFGPYIWKGPKAVYHYHIWKIECDNSIIDKMFFYYQLHLLSSSSSAHKNGAVFAHLTKGFMENYEVPVPPLKEQEKISQILSSIDQTIKKTEQIIDQTARLKKGIMQRLFTSGVSHDEYRNTTIGEIPKLWDLKNVKNLAILGPQNGLYKPSSEYGKGTFIVVLNDLYRNERKINDFLEDKVKITQNELNRYKLKENDLLVNRVSKQIEGVAKVILVDKIYDDTVYESNMIRIRLETSKILPEFYSYFSFTNAYYKQVAKIAKYSNQASVSQDGIENILVPLPSIGEQYEIVNVLNSLEDKLNIERKKLSQLNLTKKGLMEQLLTGKVRVPLDDEEVVPS
ncbi:restriction endonuclease subunit S [Pontibacillus yanchengensis]|uniref:Type I restriction modification DNA specificity domain-containing protein n=1 Tax=Pontibacillus yanchengensis Y32 TaxID=1385514 RepID=A0A0A2TG41_9BACI|nr:restriction endonuclease subunit S [Pontibacillus yanchengensis]KGP74524.1 hypothetical protein N782_12740 [Pontibacillus yanchengensis Y32]